MAAASYRSLAVCALLLTCGALCISESQAKTVKVGSNPSPWNFFVYQQWKQPAVKAGDILEFKWGPWPHTVYAFKDKSAFDNCEFSGGKKYSGVKIVGDVKYVVPTTARGSTLYFGCKYPGHCKIWGMRVAVKVDLV
eukprot:TRINITY_DN9310_c0_g1_i1.p1 TRINITY_DN9310_c0_g1~~TRINITY_DN9310_c0_g1_i1.p1  ORF type:complete len:137 (+),score=6.66 TRINITY_DN9310_c0_g1_i1:367-777(+)